MTSPTSDVYTAMCSRCRRFRTFTGTLRTSDTGRVFAEGPCDACGTLISKLIVA